MATSVLHGRALECRELSDLVARARRGGSGALVLAGPAGIGKTALLSWLTGQLAGCLHLDVSGVEAEFSIPFGGLQRLLSPLGDLAAETAAEQRDLLATVMDRSALPARGADRFAVAAAVLRLIGSMPVPVVATVDDAQWLDGESLDALGFIARRLQHEGVAVVFAVRGDPVRALAQVPVRVLAGLDVEAARALLSDLGASTPQARVGELVAATEGNPLALRALTQNLDEWRLTGARPLLGDLPIGPDLEAVYGARLRSVPAASQRALLIAALATDDRGPPTLATLRQCGITVGELLPAEAIGLVSLEHGDVRFEHPLVRSAATQLGTPPMRRAAHAAIAETIPDDAITGSLRAWHLAYGAPGPDATASERMVVVGRQALSKGAAAAAAAAFERAAELHPHASVSTDLLLLAAESALASGNGERALALVQRVTARRVAPDQALTAARLRGHIEIWGGRPLDACDWLLRAAARAAPVTERVRALLEAVYAAAVSGELTRSAAAGASALALSDDGDEVTRALGLLAAFCPQVLTGGGQGAETAVLDDVLLARSVGEPALLDDLSALAFARLVAEDYAGCRRVLTRLFDATAIDGGPVPAFMALTTRSALEFREGRWSVAYATVDQALSLAAATGRSTDVARSHVIAATITAAQGRVDECRGHLSMGIAEAAARGLRGNVAIGEIAEGSLELSLRRPEGAIGALRRAQANCEAMGAVELGHWSWPADLVEALVKARRQAEADAVVSELGATGRAPETATARALLRRAEGLVAGDGEFATHFEAALDEHDAVDRPFERARTQLCYGERLRRAKHRRAAREQLAAALSTFAALGAPHWSQIARDELAATGLSIEPRQQRGTATLTAKELQVALAVSSGLSTRQAAATLFLSPKTIEFHLASIYRKLGVHSRAELAATFPEATTSA